MEHFRNLGVNLKCGKSQKCLQNFSLLTNSWKIQTRLKSKLLNLKRLLTLRGKGVNSIVYDKTTKKSWPSTSREIRFPDEYSSVWSLQFHWTIWKVKEDFSSPSLMNRVKSGVCGVEADQFHSLRLASIYEILASH